MTRPVFPNIRDSRDDAQRTFEARQSPGRWDRRVPPHGLDLKCGHCIAGHHGPRNVRTVGDWPDFRMESDCECGQVLVGHPLTVWADHVREVLA